MLYLGITEICLISVL